MAIWANNPNYVRKVPHPAAVSNDDLKRGAEKRMAFYDAQPKAVRAEIGEIGWNFPGYSEEGLSAALGGLNNGGEYVVR